MTESRDPQASLSRRRLLTALGAAGAAAVPLLGAGSAAAAPAAAAPAGAAPAGAAAAPSSALPSRSAILAAVTRVNDHWMSAHTSPGDNQWARATYFSGLMAAYRATGDARLLRYATSWAESHNYGVSGGVSTRNADNHTAGQVYYDLYAVAPDPAKLTAINESIRLMVYGSQAAKVDDWWWVDALHMAMPVFARVAAYRHDDAYLTKMYALYRYTKTTIKLYDYGDELWYRDARFAPGGANATSPNGKKVFWARGNGWAMMAHAKVLGLLSATETRWPEYRNNLAGVARSVLRTQRGDGFFNVNMADPNDYGGPETSGTAMFAFALAYGIRAGLLDRATYLPVAARAWNGMVATAVHGDGFLGYVQGPGDRPSSSQPVTTNTTADFGVGAFLLAGTELAKLAA
jgi:unsaturated rhamnogalacturonyl hydrolase